MQNYKQIVIPISLLTRTSCKLYDYLSWLSWYLQRFQVIDRQSYFGRTMHLNWEANTLFPVVTLFAMPPVVHTTRKEDCIFLVQARRILQDLVVAKMLWNFLIIGTKNKAWLCRYPRNTDTSLSHKILLQKMRSYFPVVYALLGVSCQLTMRVWQSFGF